MDGAGEEAAGTEGAGEETLSPELGEEEDSADVDAGVRFGLVDERPGFGLAAANADDDGAGEGCDIGACTPSFGSDLGANDLRARRNGGDATTVTGTASMRRV